MQACQDAELTSSSCGQDLFTCDMLVLQQHWLFHFVGSRLSRLMLSIEPPAIYLASSRDDEGMVRSGRRNDRLAFNLRDRVGNSQYPWFVVGVNDDFVGRQSRDIEAQSLVIDPTPDQASPIIGDGKTMVFPGRDGPDEWVFFETFHQRGIQDRGVTLASSRDDARLPKVVGPPSVHGSALV